MARMIAAIRCEPCFDIGTRVLKRALIKAHRWRPGTYQIGSRFSRVVIYIRKTANGRTVWLTRVGPAMIWGPKDQALKFVAIGVARMALRSVAKTDQAEIEIDDDSAQKP
jgi:hypothetical protein